MRWERDVAKKYLDVAGVIIVSLNKNGEITLINKRGCEIIGWKEDRIIGKNWFDQALPVRIRSEVKEVFRKLMNGEEDLVKYYNNPILNTSGEERIIAWYNTVLKDQRGEIIGIMSSGEDITERTRAEEALRESEAKYKTLIQTSPDAVTVTDLEGRITYVSERTLELHGFSEPEEMLGRSAFDLIASEDKAKAILNLNKTLREGKTRHVEYRLLKKDGSRFTGEMNSAVIRDAQGRPHMFIATTRDITERKKAEQSLHRSVKEKELLLQEIHHRVKNNLQVISSLLDMTGMRIEDARAQNLITDARSKIQTMSFIHSQLYRSDRFDRIDMEEHVRDLLRYLVAIYPLGGRIVADVEIENVHLSLIQAIPCALVLNELISNSFKHAFPGRKKGMVSITMNIGGEGWAHLGVRDDGVGLGDQIDLTKTESLGLKLVRNLVEKQLKGIIRINRNPFTEFLIKFPLDREDRNHG